MMKLTMDNEGFDTEEFFSDKRYIKSKYKSNKVQSTNGILSLLVCSIVVEYIIWWWSCSGGLGCLVVNEWLIDLTLQGMIICNGWMGSSWRTLSHNSLGFGCLIIMRFSFGRLEDISIICRKCLILYSKSIYFFSSFETIFKVNYNMRSNYKCIIKMQWTKLDVSSLFNIDTS